MRLELNDFIYSICNINKIVNADHSLIKASTNKMMLIIYYQYQLFKAERNSAPTKYWAGLARLKPITSIPLLGLKL